MGASNSTITGGNLAFEQYEPAGVYDAQNPANTTVGAYDSDVFNATPQNPAVGISDGVIAGTSVEGIITVPTGTTLVQDASNVISGAQGLTKSGGGTLQLFGTNTFGGSRGYWYYDGNGSNFVAPTSGAPLTINAGRLEFNVDANLGDAASPIYMNGGTLAPLGTSASSRNITLASTVANIIDVGTGASFTVGGVVSGNGLTKAGAGDRSDRVQYLRRARLER